MEDIVNSIRDGKYTVRRYRDEATGTWTILVNDDVLMECLSEEEMRAVSDEKAVEWSALRL